MIVPHPTLETQYVDSDSGLTLPWWTLPALEWLMSKRWWLKSARVFEWGAGASSAWFRAHAGAYHAIESDPKYGGPGIEIVPPEDRHLAVVEGPELVDEPGFPLPKYVLDSLRHASYDLVVVDGIYRPMCLRFTREILAVGGILVLDNANWFDPTVAEIKGQFESYTVFPQPGRVPTWRTDVFALFV